MEFAYSQQDNPKQSDNKCFYKRKVFKPNPPDIGFNKTDNF